LPPAPVARAVMPGRSTWLLSSPAADVSPLRGEYHTRPAPGIGLSSDSGRGHEKRHLTGWRLDYSAANSTSALQLGRLERAQSLFETRVHVEQLVKPRQREHLHNTGAGIGDHELAAVLPQTLTLDEQHRHPG